MTELCVVLEDKDHVYILPGLDTGPGTSEAVRMSLFNEQIDGDDHAQVQHGFWTERQPGFSVWQTFIRHSGGTSWLLVLIYSFIRSSNIRVYSVPNPVLGTGVTEVSETEANYNLVGQIRHL